MSPNGDLGSQSGLVLRVFRTNDVRGVSSDSEAGEFANAIRESVINSQAVNVSPSQINPGLDQNSCFGRLDNPLEMKYANLKFDET